MRSCVYAVDPSVDLAKCEDAERYWLPRVIIGDVRYFNFMRLIQVVSGEVSDVREGVHVEGVTRVRHDNPWIDRLPRMFRDALSNQMETKLAELALRWNKCCDWGSYGHWIAPWDKFVEPIVFQVRAIAVYAKAHDFDLYYSQDSREDWV